MKEKLSGREFKGMAGAHAAMFTPFDARGRVNGEATDLPFLVYAFNSTLVPERDVKLFALKNVKGIKYTGSNFYACERMKRMLDKETVWFNGCDELLVSAFRKLNLI